jgi:CBS domain-containing protein
MQIPTEWEEAYPDERSLRVSILHEPLTVLNLRAPICVSPQVTARDAIRRMNDERIGAVLVMAAGELLGVFTERDVLKKLVDTETSLDTPVRELMTPEPACLHGDDAVIFALKLMHEGGFRHVPLLDANDRPVGLVSMRDVIDFVVRIFAKELATVPPDSSHFTPSSSEGA